VIGSRALSNGDASRKKSKTKIRQALNLQGVAAESQNYTKFPEAIIPVSFCAGNKIFAMLRRVALLRKGGLNEAIH